MSVVSSSKRSLVEMESTIDIFEARGLRPPLKVARTMSYSAPTEELIPPENFALVAGSVYRGAFPKAENFSYLRMLGLKTILTLVPETYPEANVRFMEENGITHIQIGMPGNKEQGSQTDPQVSDEKITHALRVVLNKANHPILIHCNKGKHRTGCVVGCLRKFQAWSVASILEEYRRYAGAKSRERDQVKIDHYRLDGCLDVAIENGWIPTTMVLQGEKEVELAMPVTGRAAIKAQ